MSRALRELLLTIWPRRRSSFPGEPSVLRSTPYIARQDLSIVIVVRTTQTSEYAGYGAGYTNVFRANINISGIHKDS